MLKNGQADFSISALMITCPLKLFAKTALLTGPSFLMEKSIISFYLKLTEFPTQAKSTQAANLQVGELEQ